jgi:hypothetical protein
MASTGPTTTEAVQRRLTAGPNEVRSRGRISVHSSIGLQLRDPPDPRPPGGRGLTVLTGDLTDAVGRKAPHCESPGEPFASGTVVVKGPAVARVTGTGALSALGRIAALPPTATTYGPVPRVLGPCRGTARWTSV